MGKKVYLDNLPRQETLANYIQHLIKQGVRALPAERLPVEAALGRTVAGVVRAALSNPHYPASAMDGGCFRGVQSDSGQGRATHVGPHRKRAQIAAGSAFR